MLVIESIPRFGLIAEEVEKMNPDLVIRGEDLMFPQCGEVGYGILVGLLSRIVIRPINSGLAPRPGGKDVAHDIRDIIIAASVNPHPWMILPPIILSQRERREEEEQASETFHVSQGISRLSES